MTTLTLGNNTIHTQAPELLQARLDAFIAAVAPVMQGFQTTATKHHNSNHNWEGDQVSSGFPPLDSLISVLTSSKFEAHLVTALELLGFAVLMSLYLIVETSKMIWDNWAEQRHSAYQSFVSCQTSVKVQAVLMSAKDKAISKLDTTKTDLVNVALGGLASLTQTLEAQA